MMSNSKLSTKSVSRNGILKKDFVISGEFITGKSEGSLDLSSSLVEKDSSSFKELGNKELNFIADLDALDASIIQNDSKSVSIIKEFHYEEDRREDVKKTQLFIENDQVRVRPWCASCLNSGESPKSSCLVI
jgi:hypothetical protein